MRTKLAVASLFAVTIAWGGAFVGIKVLVEDLGYIDLTIARFVFTSILLAGVFPFFKPEAPIQRRDWPVLAILGALGVGGYHLSINYGELTVSAGVASLIVSSVPVMVALLAPVFIGERLTRRRGLGVTVALGGVVLLTLLGTPGAQLEVGSVLGAAVTTLAPLAWAFNTVLSKPLAGRIGATPLTIIMVLLGTAMLLPLGGPRTIARLGALDVAGWLWLAYLVIPCTVGGYLAWFWALRQLDATRTAAFVYLVPLWALIWAWAVLGERLTVWTALGGALVLGGVYLVEGRRKLAPPPRAPELMAAQPKKTSATE